MFSLLGLLLVLGAVALAGLRPWASSAVAPDLSVAPEIGVALGDSTVVARADSPRVASGSPAVGTGGIAAPGAPAAVSVPAVVTAPGESASRPTLAVSPARPLQAVPAAPTSSPPAAGPVPAPEPVAATPAPQSPAAQPVVATVPGGGQGTSGGPVSSGVGSGQPGPGCEGDAYRITVSFDEGEDADAQEGPEAEGGEEEAEGGEEGQPEADILIQRLGSDGSEAEVQLRGDINDVRELVATLVSEGNCVEVDIRPSAEGDPEEEASNPGTVTAEPGETPESQSRLP